MLMTAACLDITKPPALEWVLLLLLTSQAVFAVCRPRASSCQAVQEALLGCGAPVLCRRCQPGHGNGSWSLEELKEWD